MEDPESEWKIQEYYSSSNSKEEDEEDKPNVVRRILSNGYVIGKEFVITGIFISSAPLVVPSLVVVSALGFVFTVPFGVLLTSYVCTNKIMNMLFPAPVPSPLRLEYYYSDGDGDEDYERMDRKFGLGLVLDDDVVEKYEGEEEEGYVIDEEDNVFLEDGNEEVVKEIGFESCDDNRQLGDNGAEVEGFVTDKEDNEIVADVNEEVEAEIEFEFSDDSSREGEISIANADEDVLERKMEDDMPQREINDTEEEEEREQMEDVVQGVEMRSNVDVVGYGDQGYEKDAGGYLEGDDGSLEEELKGEERLVDNWDDESESGTHEVNGDVMLRDKGCVDNTVEDYCIVSESASDVVFGDVKDVGTTIPVTSESASDVAFGDVKDVGTTISLTRESVSDVVSGDVKDVGITIPVTVGEIESEKLADEHVGDMRHVVNLSDGDVDELEMEDDMLPRENVAAEKEREQVEDIIGVEMRLRFDVATDDDQGDEKDAAEYLEGNDDSLEEELKGEKLLVDDRQEVNEDPKVMEVGRVDHVNNTIEDGCVVSEGASNVVLGDVEDVETNKPVTSVNASDVGFGDVKDVETTKQVTSESSSNSVFGDDDDVGTTEPVTVIEIESEKLIEKGNKNDEPIGEMRHVVVILSDGNDANNFNSRVVDELDLVAREVIGDANRGERTIESAEQVLRKSMGTQGNNGSDHAYKDGSEDALIMLSMEEHLVHSNADALDIDEEDLLDERNTNNNFKDGNEEKENAADDNVDVLGCAPSKRNTDNGNEVKENVVYDNVKRDTDKGNEVKENAAADKGNEVKKNADDDNVDVLGCADTDNAKVVYKKVPSREENLDDKKIWEKIAAMRTIVGYKAPAQPTCIGELKALYVFTGVEPPASFDADSDLDAKLKFLMAIVGVK